MRKLQILRNVAILSTLIVAGCEGVDLGELPEESPLTVAGPSELKADRPSISFTELSDTIDGSIGATETRKLFTTASAYKTFFGHKAPASVRPR